MEQLKKVIDSDSTGSEIKTDQFYVDEGSKLIDTIK